MALPVSSAAVGAEERFYCAVFGRYSEKVLFFVVKKPIPVGTSFEFGAFGGRFEKLQCRIAIFRCRFVLGKFRPVFTEMPLQITLVPEILDLFGCGATVPLSGFGHLLADGVRKAVDEKGLLGVLSGGLSATSAGISAAVFFGLLFSLVFKPKEK